MTSTFLPWSMSRRAAALAILFALAVLGLLRTNSPAIPYKKESPRPQSAALPPAAPLPDSPLLDSLLRSSPQLARVATNPAYQLQVIYTQIDRGQDRQPRFTTHTYHVDARRYFNPASLVKLPVAALSLEKLRQLHLSRQAIIVTGAAFRCQTPVPFAAPADSDQWATVGNYVKRMLLVSDNVAYNRLYEFLGQRPLNERLWSLGYPGVRITRRFAPCDTAANRYTNPITFRSPRGDTLYKQPAQVNRRPLDFPLGTVRVGEGYRAGGELIRRPFDFTTANYLPLADVTTMLRNLLFPAVAPQSFALAPEDYVFLRRYLHNAPHESGFSLYRPRRYFDAYKKYLYYGRQPSIPQESGLRIYNVVGMSYGYLADVAYFADSRHQSDFMLSAVLYVNQDGIINDGAYEYESIGLPFLARLGHVLRDFEAKRPHQSRPTAAELFTGGDE